MEVFKHCIGHNLFAYDRSPNGVISELFAELDQMKDECGRKILRLQTCGADAPR
jgi:hypothetical protein